MGSTSKECRSQKRTKPQNETKPVFLPPTRPHHGREGGLLLRCCSCSTGVCSAPCKVLLHFLAKDGTASFLERPHTPRHSQPNVRDRGPCPQRPDKVKTHSVCVATNGATQNLARGAQQRASSHQHTDLLCQVQALKVVLALQGAQLWGGCLFLFHGTTHEYSLNRQHVATRQTATTRTHIHTSHHDPPCTS